MSRKLKGTARTTTNVVAATHGDEVDASFDNYGRQLTRYQARDLLHTAYVSLATGTKTVLRAGVAGAYLDLYQISFSSNSATATVLTITDESTTVLVVPVPATPTVVNLDFTIPLKQSAKGVAWYVDIPDIIKTTVEINAMFSQEI